MCPILHRLTGILCSLGDENSLSHFSFLFVPFSFMIVNYGCEYRSSPHGQGSMDGLHPRLHNLIGLPASEMEFSTFSFFRFPFYPLQPCLLRGFQACKPDRLDTHNGGAVTGASGLADGMEPQDIRGEQCGFLAGQGQKATAGFCKVYHRRRALAADHRVSSPM